MSTRLRILLTSFALIALALATAAPGGREPASFAPVRHPDERVFPLMPVPPKPTKGEIAVRVALRAVGVRYRWGGESPATGFDCSGLVRWAYGHVGVDLPHSSYALYGKGRPVRQARLKPGDVLFFEGLGHVGMYMGKGRMVHSPQSGRHVEVVNLAQTNYGRRLIGARRVAV